MPPHAPLPRRARIPAAAPRKRGTPWACRCRPCPTVGLFWGGAVHICMYVVSSQSETPRCDRGSINLMSLNMQLLHLRNAFETHLSHVREEVPFVQVVHELPLRRHQRVELGGLGVGPVQEGCEWYGWRVVRLRGGGQPGMGVCDCTHSGSRAGPGPAREKGKRWKRTREADDDGAPVDALPARALLPRVQLSLWAQVRYVQRQSRRGLWTSFLVDG